MDDIFEVFQKFRIKLNLLKCALGVPSGKFLGHVVSKRGIKPNLMQIKTLSEIVEPKTIWDVQSLDGKIVTLGRFISKMSNRCKYFFQIIKQSTLLEWGEEHSREF